MYSKKELEAMSLEDLRILIGSGLTNEEGRKEVFEIYLRKKRDPHEY